MTYYTRIGFILRNGSRVSRFYKALCFAFSQSVLCHSQQKQYQLSPHLFKTSRQDNRIALRSNNRVNRRELAKDYPEQLRLIKFYDSENKKLLTFLTNNFLIKALTVAQLYKSRWKIELFFRWIKQHLRIKAFFGTSQNAVKTQIWIAISIYVLVAIIKKRLGLKPELFTILQILSVSIFDKIDIFQPLMETELIDDKVENDNQLQLFNL